MLSCKPTNDRTRFSIWLFNNSTRVRQKKQKSSMKLRLYHFQRYSYKTFYAKSYWPPPHSLMYVQLWFLWRQIWVIRPFYLPIIKIEPKLTSIVDNDTTQTISTLLYCTESSSIYPKQWSHIISIIYHVSWMVVINFLWIKN